MFDSSIAGIRNGLAMAETAARNIARSEPTDPSDHVRLMVAQRVVEANVVALRTSLATSGALLDLIA